MKNPIFQAKQIKEDFSEYIKSMFIINDPEYNNLFHSELKRMGSSLFKGPYLSSVLPFEKDENIKTLIEKGVLSGNFIKLGGISELKYRLYVHQVAAIKKIESGRNVVVTTGTGSGKTECFLYPILDKIIREIDAGNKESGIRAIFLFPMNALINDQIDRIRSLLKTYPEIKFGFYTGETPENGEDVAKKRYEEKYGVKLADNELVTREQMRENPPHILFTNYSMLEYLLIRPSDSFLISPESLKYWKYVVLDEAHTYRGSLGMEISVLLRRLVGMSNAKPNFILTSATLGHGERDVDKIIKFAKELTSSNFEKEDIIFSTRHYLPDHGNYSVEVNDYESMLEAEKKEDVVGIFEKYLNYDDSLSVEENLYRLLVQDSNVLKLYQLSKNGREVLEILEYFSEFNIETFTAMVELIAKATSKEGYKLYDIKYHMFVKAPDGAFITLGNNKKLKLITCKQIDGKKAFKIGICQNCKTPYVMGIIDDNNILSIDDEIDIDEDYLEKQKRLGYFLIADTLQKSELEEIDSDKEHYKKYLVCPTCGHIRRANDAKGTKCDCGVEDEVVLYGLIDSDNDSDDDIYSNNIKKCPICDFSTTSGGVVVGFHIGKDRATSLLAQILYRSMDYPKIKTVTTGMFGEKIAYKNGVKQFIAFSDARQQAAFFNKFLNYNDERMLKKRLIWEELNTSPNDNKPIKYSNLVDKISSRYADLFAYDNDEALKLAKSACLWELLQVDGRNSAEGLGLLAFDLDLPNEYSNSKQIEAYLKQQGYSVNADDFRTLTKISLDIFRTVPAIKYDPISFDEKEKDDLLGYRKFVNFVVEQAPKEKEKDQFSKRIHSFLPVDSTRETKLVKFVEKAFELTKDKAVSLLRLVYETAKNTNLIVDSKKDSNKVLDQIEAKRYSVHSYKNTKFYICNKCKKLTMHNINDMCEDGDCDGKLVECNPDIELKDNYYRNEYISRPLERVVSREHTAQIKSAEAKQIQQDFKDKKINIISCSTTFEMGIDLDKLDTVFMRNIPPTPANYAQRAGRAGRRADSSAFILSFCGMSSHDYTFFNDPSSMLSGLVDPPDFATDNERILIRHIAASALGFFFRKNPQGFESIKTFLEGEYIDKFIEYVSSKPNELGEYIDQHVLCDPDLLQKYGNFKWIDYVQTSSKGSLENLKTGILETKDTYEKAIEKLRDEKPRQYGKLIDQYSEAIRRLEYKNSLIQYLARYGVIPRYGFPVDNATLKIYDMQKADFDDKYDLTRDLSIAISEYAPESEVIVDGKKYTSRYIYTPYPGAPQDIMYYVECKNCKQFNLAPNEDHFDDDCECLYCHKKLHPSGQDKKRFIRPIKGFVADQFNKATKKMKPVRSYASDIQYIGLGKNPVIEPININEVIEISEFKSEELLILNENRFFYCPTCGYTVLDRKNMATIEKRHHKDHKGIDCKNETLEFVNLGHTFRTDIVKMKFLGIPEMSDYDTAVSVLYALLEGISMAFSIDRNDIGGLVYRSDIGSHEFVLFDNVSGGAGHVKKLENKDNVISVLRCGLEKVSQNCCDEDTSCYSCLRNFNNQRIHNHLIRGKAKSALEHILDSVKTKKNVYGITNKSESFDDINDFNDFDYSMYCDEDIRLRLFNEIRNEINANNCNPPSAFGLTLLDQKNNKLYADFYWEKEEMLLLSIDNNDTYELLGEGKSKYTCFLMDDYLDIAKLIKMIKGE